MYIFLMDVLLDHNKVILMPSATRVLLYGLEKSGKSTIIESFKTGHFTQGIPSTAHKTYDILVKNILPFSIIEVGGRKEVRGFVTKYLDHIDSIVFVIDGSDEGSFQEVKTEFFKILNHPLSLGKPLAILFHKKDIATVHPSIIIDKLDLLNRYDRPHRVFSTSAHNPKLFMEVLAWLHNCLIEEKQLFQDKYSRLLTIYILDMLEEKKMGLPLLAILGQLEIISRTGQVEFNRDKTILLLRKLRESGELNYNESTQVWSITLKGYEKLQNPDLIKGTKYEKLRAVLDGGETGSSVSEEFELDELAELFDKTTRQKRKNL
jgi:GTPase SAR1 family protein